MIEKPDFRKLRPVPRDIMSRVFTDELSPDFQFGISVRPLLSFSSLSLVNQKTEELLEKYVTGKYDPEIEGPEEDKYIKQIAVTPSNEIIQITPDVCNSVAMLLVCQSDKDDKGQASPVYDEYELLCVQHAAPEAFMGATAFVGEITAKAREKKVKTPTPPATPPSTAWEPSNTDATLTSETASIVRGCEVVCTSDTPTSTSANTMPPRKKASAKD